MKRILVLMLVVLLVVLGATSIASAQVPPPVVTKANVTAGSTAPVVVNAFMLPDMNEANGLPVDTIAPYEPAPNGLPVNAVPNLYNTPTQYLGFWAFLTSAGGIGSISDVWADVYHPDGSLKYQLHMVPVTCESLGTPTTANTPAAGAVATGQKTAAEFNGPLGIIEQCNQGLLAPYYAVGTITKDQPFGLYKYTIGATALGGGSVVSGFYFFEVLQIAGLAIDFSLVDFGSLNPLSPKVTDGDAVWGPILPTVASVGNVWLNLVVDYDPMLGTIGQPSANKVIDVFDFTIGKTTASENPLGQPRQTSDPIWAQANGSTADAVTMAPFTLPSNCPTKVQFSVHPEIVGIVRTATGQLGVPSGDYTGVVKLTGVASGNQWQSDWATALPLCHYAIPAQ